MKTLTKVVIIALGLSLPLMAGERDGSELETLLRELNEKLDLSSAELAEEYIEVLEKLSNLLDDYSEYFRELEGEQSARSSSGFKPIVRKLRSGSYVDDPGELQDDIRTYMINLEKQTGEHNHNRECRESCLMLKNLKRELSVLSQHVDDYLSLKTRKQLRRKEILDYLRVAVARLNERETEYATAETSDQSETEPSGIAVAISPNSSPLIPGVEIVEGIEESSLRQRLFSDSLDVDERFDRITVTNPAGDVRVTGWNRPLISATLEIVVASIDESQETAFLNNTKLVLDTAAGEYVVVSKFPPTAEAGSGLIKSSLVIRVPTGKKLNVSSSFGQISVADIQDDLKVEGHHCDINIDNTSGAADISNSSGTIRLTDLAGNLFTECSYGTIELTACIGDIRAENTYSDIRAYDCSGTAAFRGSGSVYIQGFSGALDISNSYGPVEVRDVDGDLEATNAYDALIVRGITGEANLENAYAKITVYKIGGPLSASNSNGIILAEGMRGPVSLENESGDIKIVLDRSLGGNSTIVNSDGAIDIAFLRRGDFVLNASTTLGRINSRLPLRIEKKGDLKSTAVTFGRGLDSVLLVGNNTVINISEEN